MAFYEQLFPTGISSNMRGGPRFQGAMEATTIGGQRYTNLMDPHPLHLYTFAKPAKMAVRFETLRAFFWAVRGIDGFRFKDESDHDLTQDNSSLSLISGTTWQLNRLYVSPGRTAVRPLYKPVAGLQIFRDRSGVVENITGTSVIDFTTGRVEITGHVALDTYSAEGEFHVPVAFTDPEAIFNWIGGTSSLTEWPDISVRETREYT